MGVGDDLIPHPRCDDTDEERRLLYVGMTRAMRKLHLSYPTTRRTAGAYGGGSRAVAGSPFLRHLPLPSVTRKLEAGAGHEDDAFFSKPGHLFMPHMGLPLPGLPISSSQPALPAAAQHQPASVSASQLVPGPSTALAGSGSERGRKRKAEGAAAPAASGRRHASAAASTAAAAPAPAAPFTSSATSVPGAGAAGNGLAAFPPGAASGAALAAPGLPGFMPASYVLFNPALHSAMVGATTSSTPVGSAAAAAAGFAPVLAPFPIIVQPGASGVPTMAPFLLPFMLPTGATGVLAPVAAAPAGTAPTTAVTAAAAPASAAPRAGITVKAEKLEPK